MSTEYVDVTFAVTGDRLTDDEQESLAVAFEAWCTVAGREPVTMATNPRDPAERDRQVAEQAAAEEREQIWQSVDSDMTLYAEIEALCLASDNPSTLADKIQDVLCDKIARARADSAAQAAPCPQCGPGYRYGDDGCHHTAPARPTTDDREALIAEVARLDRECNRLDLALQGARADAAALASRPTTPTPTVSEEQVERLRALLRFPAKIEGTEWVSAAALRGLLDSTTSVTARRGTVGQVAAILRIHYDHPDGEGAVECVCGGYEGPGDIFDHQAERVLTALGVAVTADGGEG